MCPGAFRDIGGRANRVRDEMGNDVSNDNLPYPFLSHSQREIIASHTNYLSKPNF